MQPDGGGWALARTTADGGIVLTDAGRRLYAALKDEAATVRQELVARIELEKLAHLTELLEQIRCILEPRHALSPTHDQAKEYSSDRGQLLAR